MSEVIGVDTGGTFTDLIKVGEDGSLQVEKLLSTPEDPSRAIGDGVFAVLGGEDPDVGSAEVVHGTTVATNALLERRGARVALVTTAGFEDLLWLARQNRPDLYALRPVLAAPLVARECVFGVAERLDYTGQVVLELSDGEIERVVTLVEAAGLEAVVISLLHSYANGEHEERLRHAFHSASTEWHITTSREVTATFREYERTSTATVNGYVGPVMSRYFARLRQRLAGVGSVEVLQSHGGRATLEEAAAFPVHTALSGPAGGVVGALASAAEVGIKRVITFDMGGTSTDVSLADGAPTLTREAKISRLPMQVPVVDIHTVGAGGGSIAFVDPGGALKVGPRSAGAAPGPAAYGRGGRESTVTDAHVALGTLLSDHFLGGAMALDRGAAQAAVERLGEELGLGWRATAQGILEIADAAMARAIKVVSLERGHDLRDYTLVAFGGAGGLHACRVAGALEMERVLVPWSPGVLSALGMVRAAAQRLYNRTVLFDLQEVQAAPQPLHRAMAELAEEARRALPEATLSWRAGLRYRGQSHSIDVELGFGATDAPDDKLRERFEKEHQRLFGSDEPGRAVEIVDLELRATGPRPHWPGGGYGTGGADEATVNETRRIDVGRGEEDVRVLSRRLLAEGDLLEGPAVITEYSGTTVLQPDWSLRVEGGHLILFSR